MKYIIDTEKFTVTEIRETGEKKIVCGKTLADAFQADLGATEWDSVVERIQTWYYGVPLHDPWCATAVSYYADTLGILGMIGGKNENVYLMLKSIERIGLCRKINHREEEVKRGDILFFLWKGEEMSTTSSKHVGVCEQNSYPEDYIIYTIGGNQSRKIQVKKYDRSKLYAVYRPIYV